MDIEINSPGLQKEPENVWETCIFCDGKFDLNALHPSIVKQCGTHPKWCRSCNYYFWHYAAILTDDLLEIISARKKTAGDVRRCEWCKNKFNLLKYFYGWGSYEYQDLVYPGVFGFDWSAFADVDFLYPNLYTNICPACFRTCFHYKYHVQPDEQAVAVRRLGEKLGKLPGKDFAAYLYHFSNSKDVIWFLGLLQVLPSPQEIRDRFDSYFKLLLRSGLLPDGTRRMRIGTWVLAKDGDMCFSLAERDVDDWLFAHRIEHNKEVQYPNSTMRCDWEVVCKKERFFIEYLGLMSKSAYAEKIKAKRAIADQHGIRLIEILPNTDWKRLLASLFLDGD